jgi:hypothetical protein
MIGSTRSGRGLAALSPAQAPVDGRSLPQLMCFVAEFARLLQFVELDGSDGGDWRPFFAHDLSFLLAHILCFDAARESAAVEEIVHGVADPGLREERILARVFALFQQVSGWAIGARNIGAAAALGTPASLSLEKLLREQLAPLYRSLLDNAAWALLWQPWQSTYYATLATDDRAWLAAQWEGDGSVDAGATPDLHSAHLSFLHYIDGVMAPMQGYFGDALENTFGHQPHTALMTAFLRLLRYAQADANAITGRHLDFYYRTVLRLQERAPVPDRALLSFRPSPASSGSLLPAGTRLKAGKLANGQDLLYAVDEDLVVNQDTIAALKTVHASPTDPLWPGGPAGISRLYAAPQANSEDGAGAPLSRPELGWPTFGRDWDRNPRVTDSAPLADIGLLITSPTLLLKGGRRALRVRFQYAQKPAAIARSPLAQAAADGNAAAPPPTFATVAEAYHQAVAETFTDFAGRSLDMMAFRAMSEACEVWLTTQAGWQQVGKIAVRGNLHEAWLELVMVLPASFPAVVPGPPAPQEAGGSSPWPRLKIMLKPDARVYPYAFIQQLCLQGITLRAVVAGLAPATMLSSQGALNTKQPFYPLGNTPIIGSYLEIADPELAGKPIVHAGLRVQWFNLPQTPDDLAQRYAGYSTPPLENRSFQVAFQAQRAGRWTAVGAARPLFTAQDQAGAPLQSTLWFGLDLPSGPSLKWDGLRMQLVAPAGAFGHEQYPQLVTAAALKAAAAISSETVAALKILPGQTPVPPAPPPKLPKAPFVPQAQQITLDYVAFEPLSAMLAPDELSAPQPCFYQIGPFGHLPARFGGTTLLDGLQRHGQLYIGLSKLVPGQIVSLLFGMCETEAQQQAVRRGWPASVDGELAAAIAVSWYYLLDNQWQRFAPREVLSDGTNGLTGSGIVRLQTRQHQLNNDNTLMPPGVFWIAAAVDHADAHSHTLLLDTQGAAATQLLTGLNPLAGGPLPPNSIQAFVSKPAGIQSVSQALPTLGGQAAESAQDFRVRVSERLRHKQRAVRALDFEQIVLDAFPSVAQAKCITPNLARARQYRCDAVPPGSVGVVVVPQPPQDAAHAAKPVVPVGSLLQIRQLLLRHCSASFTKLLVLSPQYEELKVCLRVELEPDCDFVYYRHQLNDAISAWLAPWRTDGSAPLAIGGGTLNMNDLYVFLANFAGVARVVELSALHIFEYGGKRLTRWLKRDEALMPATPWSVLVPAEQHFITDSDESYGIGNMAVGEDVMSFRRRPHATLTASTEPPSAPAAARYTLSLPAAALIHSAE